MPILYMAAALLGLAVGSFLNVVIYRVPLGHSLVNPPSRCPHCETPIRNRHNVPVFGWLWLRGRCASCRAPISPRYPIVELATAVLFVALTVRLAHDDLLAAIPAYLYLASIGVALTMIDIDVKRLPNSIVLPSYVVLGTLLLAAAGVGHNWDAAIRALMGGTALYLWYFAIAWIYPAGMGFGDVKLAGLLGAALTFLSWPTLAVGAFGAFLLGGIGGAIVMATGRGGRKTAIPFGPFMIGSAILAIFTAQPIWNLYTRVTLTI